MKKLALYTLLLFGIPASAQSPFKIFDINTAVSGSSYPGSFSAYNGKLYFLSTPVNLLPLQLTSTDGQSTIDTIFNTKMLTGGGINITVACNGKLYFSGMTNDTAAIYSYDGVNTAVVAYKYKPTGTGPIFKPISYMVAHNNILYFANTDNNGDAQLWSFNTNNSASTKISSFPGTAPPKEHVKNLVVYNSKIYFSGDESLWEYNPSNSALNKVSANATFPTSLTEYNGKLYYMAQAAVGASAGRWELFCFDGSTSVQLTSMLIDVSLHTCYRSLGGINNSICFSARNYSNGYTSLYKYDIVAKTTTLITKITADNRPLDYFAPYNGLLYFNAYTDDKGGYNLWSYDGSNLPSIVYYSSTSGPNSPTEPIVFNNCLFFSGRDATKRVELFRYYQPKAGINSVSFPGTINIYPNPSHNTTTLELTLTQPETLSVSVTDIQGRVVYNIPATAYDASKHSINIPMQVLSIGTYFYRINNKEGVLVAGGKLVKE